MVILSPYTYALAWNCDGSILASGSTDSMVRLWPRAVGKVASEIDGHSEAIHCLAWDPSAVDRYATVSKDRTCRLWNVPARSSIHVINLNAEYYNLSYSSDGKYLAAGNNENICLIDPKKGKILKKMANPYDIFDIKFNNSSDYLFFVGAHPNGHGTLEILQITKNVSNNTTNSDGGINKTSSSGRNILMQNIYRITTQPGKSKCLAFNKKGTLLAVGGNDSMVGIWDVKELMVLHFLPRADTEIRNISFSFDDQFLAYSCESNLIYIYHIATGRRAFVVKLSKPATNICWHPKQNLLAYIGDAAETDGFKGREGIIKFVKIVQNPETQKIL